MPEMKPLEQFYSKPKLWREKAGDNLTKGMHIAQASGTLKYDDSFEVEISPGDPVVIGDALAPNWLAANYLYATNFMEGRPPAMGEIAASIHDNHQEPEGIYIDITCFKDIQAVFRAMRKVEDVYRDELAMPVLEKLKMGLPINDMDSLLETSDSIRAFSEVFRNHYYPKHWAGYPLLSDGTWVINTPSLFYPRKSLSKDCEYVIRYMHSHPPDLSWLSSLASDGDISCMVNGDFRSMRYGKDVGMTPWEYYIMHMPKFVLMELNNDGEVLGCGNEPRKKLAALKRKRELFRSDLG